MKSYKPQKNLFCKWLDIACRIIKVIWIADVVLVFLIVIVTLLHVKFYICPFYFAKFDRSKLVPILYGYGPSPRTIERARRGEIALGGCQPGIASAICPYCRIWPAQLANWNVEPKGEPQDIEGLKNLPPDEYAEIERFTKDMLKHTQLDLEEKFISAEVSDSDVWMGTVHNGLYRFDRTTKRWKQFNEEPVGPCIKRIWSVGPRIYIEHLPFGIFVNHTFSYVDYTDDRGQTWVRYWGK